MASAGAPVLQSRRKLLIIVPDSSFFRSLAAYAQSSLVKVFEPIDVLVHSCRSSQSDFTLRRRSVGLMRALDERLYCLAESIFTPWQNAADRLALDLRLNTFAKLSSLRDPAFEDFVNIGAYDALLALGCEYVPVERLAHTLTALNIHPGILPRYRGLGNPEAWLRQDFGNMGVTIHHMTKRLDGGKVVAQRRIAGMKHLNIPLGYLIAYKVGIDMLRCAGPLPYPDSAGSSNDASQQAVALWRMRFTLYVLGHLGRLAH